MSQHLPWSIKSFKREKRERRREEEGRKKREGERLFSLCIWTIKSSVPWYPPLLDILAPGSWYSFRRVQKATVCLANTAGVAGTDQRREASLSNIFTQPTILRMEMHFLEKQDSSLTLNISLVRKTVLKSGSRKLPDSLMLEIPSAENKSLCPIVKH